MGPYGPQPGPGPHPDWAPTVKDKTVANIGSEVARIEKKVSEFTGDRSETKQELDALLEYLEKLTKQCHA